MNKVRFYRANYNARKCLLNWGGSDNKNQKGDLCLHLRYQKQHKNVMESIHAKERVSIHQRPSIVDERSRIADWEADTVIGQQGGEVLVTLVERKTLYVTPVHPGIASSGHLTVWNHCSRRGSNFFSSIFIFKKPSIVINAGLRASRSKAFLFTGYTLLSFKNAPFI